MNNDTVLSFLCIVLTELLGFLILHFQSVNALYHKKESQATQNFYRENQREEESKNAKKIQFRKVFLT